MATLILTAIGTAVGGPVGGAIGALIGQQADALIFAPKPRQGPRLGELAVQTSSYGTAIPRLFGRMRAAGTVIWATDLQEHRTSSGGGKGRASTVNYSYSASFAVALSGRPIQSVGRVWADGKLLRGGAGDFKTATGYRLHLGGEHQQLDPLLAAAEGIESTPAYRGIAYAVFEDFQLADYGNRIPSLSFEIEADPAPVSIGTIASELSDGLIEDGGTSVLAGYAASGESVRAAIEGLAELGSLSLIEADPLLRLAAPTGTPLFVNGDEADASSGQAGGRMEILRLAADAVSDEVAIAYYDADRDWQTGLQRATLGSVAHRADRIALPAALDASAAKALAEIRLATVRAARVSAKIHMPWRYARVRPGARIAIASETGLWQVKRSTFQQMVVTLDLARLAGGTLPASAEASPGRPVQEPDLLHGPTVVRLLDIPLASTTNDGRLQLLAAAAGPEPAWRRAILSASFDGGASWIAAGRTATPATMGSAVSVLVGGGSALFDRIDSVDVELLNDAMWLESRDDAALLGGANLALLGGELIQFGSVEPLGDRRFRLARLLRGRRGTEWATGEHAIGDPFVLIDAETLARIDVPLSVLGSEARIAAEGIGDADGGIIQACLVTGESRRPPSPVHLRAARQTTGDIAVSWVRRSRSGWVWLDGGEVPVGEERELYQLRFSTTTTSRSASATSPAHLHSVADQAGDGGGPLTIEVVQVGTVAPSRPATTILERP